MGAAERQLGATPRRFISQFPRKQANQRFRCAATDLRGFAAMCSSHVDHLINNGQLADAHEGMLQMIVTWPDTHGMLRKVTARAEAEKYLSKQTCP